MRKLLPQVACTFLALCLIVGYLVCIKHVQNKEEQKVLNETYVVLISGGRAVAEFMPARFMSVTKHDGSQYMHFEMPDGHYVNWSGDYLLTDIPVDVSGERLVSFMGG